MAVLQPQSPPCADSDKSERCQLKRAVSAALDEIKGLKDQVDLARQAIEKQEIAIKAANDALAASAKEREAYDTTLKIADKAIGQLQGIVTTYEKAIATLQTMVDMAMKRIDKLEDKVDAANGRTAKLGVILTILGVVAAVVKK